MINKLYLQKLLWTNCIRYNRSLWYKKKLNKLQFSARINHKSKEHFLHFYIQNQHSFLSADILVIDEFQLHTGYVSALAAGVHAAEHAAELLGLYPAGRRQLAAPLQDQHQRGLAAAAYCNITYNTHNH